LEGPNISVVGLDDDGLFGVFGEGVDLSQGWVAFDKVLLRSMISQGHCIKMYG
jgi:hypothetical protein